MDFPIELWDAIIKPYIHMTCQSCILVSHTFYKIIKKAIDKIPDNVIIDFEDHPGNWTKLYPNNKYIFVDSIKETVFSWLEQTKYLKKSKILSSKFIDIKIGWYTIRTPLSINELLYYNGRIRIVYKYNYDDHIYGRNIDFSITYLDDQLSSQS